MSERLTDANKMGAWLMHNVCSKCSTKGTTDCSYFTCGEYIRWQDWIDKTADYFNTVVIPAAVKAARKELIEWGEQLCTDDSHCSGYWDNNTFNDKGETVKLGNFHHDKRFNCDECMQQLKQKQGM
jgi:hypothetical protein